MLLTSFNPWNPTRWPILQMRKLRLREVNILPTEVIYDASTVCQALNSKHASMGSSPMRKTDIKWLNTTQYMQCWDGGRTRKISDSVRGRGHQGRFPGGREMRTEYWKTRLTQAGVGRWGVRWEAEGIFPNLPPLPSIIDWVPGSCQEHVKYFTSIILVSLPSPCKVLLWFPFCWLENWGSGRLWPLLEVTQLVSSRTNGLGFFKDCY